jgi:uncharacterized C2H2 Zn-finger protein
MGYVETGAMTAIITTGAHGDLLARCPNCDARDPLISIARVKGAFKYYFHRTRGGELWIDLVNKVISIRCPSCSQIVVILDSEVQ